MAKNRASVDVGLLLLRLVVGVVFIAHGAQKLFGVLGGMGMESWIGMVESLQVFGNPVPRPTIAAWVAACSEFVGGILVLTGFLTRLGALAIFGTMAVAVIGVHWGSFFMVMAVPEGAKPGDALPHGMEYALTLGVVALALLIAGPGRYSLMGCIKGECGASQPQPEPDTSGEATEPADEPQGPLGR